MHIVPNNAAVIFPFVIVLPVYNFQNPIKMYISITRLQSYNFTKVLFAKNTSHQIDDACDQVLQTCNHTSVCLEIFLENGLLPTRIFSTHLKVQVWFAKSI